eukprot:6470846-Amphidinium_carterae.1
MSLDSKEFFKARALSCGLSEERIQAMCGRGWGTMATYAFSSPYVPGTQDETAFAKKVLIPLLGSIEHEDAPKLRRLVYEAYTTAALDSQARQSRNTDDVPRKLPLQEKSAR